MENEKYTICSQCDHVVGKDKPMKSNWWGGLICPDCGNAKFYQSSKIPDNNKNHDFSANDDSLSEKSTNKEKINHTDNRYEIKQLNMIIDDLRAKGKKAISSRDKWRERAEIAEEKLTKSQSASDDMKFKRLKIMFSKMYHPDCITGDRFEKMIKQEIFKEFWQVIESIEKNDE